MTEATMATSLSSKRRSASFALVPRRGNELLLGGDDNNNNPDEIIMASLIRSSSRSCTRNDITNKNNNRLPFVLLFDKNDDDTTSDGSSLESKQQPPQVVGRIDFLHALWAACLRSKRKDERNSAHPNMVCMCQNCKEVNAWSETKMALETRRLFTVERVVVVGNNNNNNNSDDEHRDPYVVLTMNKRREYPLECIQIVTNTGEGKQEVTITPDRNKSWNPVPVGSILRIFREPSDHEPILEFQLVVLHHHSHTTSDDDEQQQVAADAEGSSSSSSQPETQVGGACPSTAASQVDGSNVSSGPTLETQRPVAAADTSQNATATLQHPLLVLDGTTTTSDDALPLLLETVRNVAMNYAEQVAPAIMMAHQPPPAPNKRQRLHRRLPLGTFLSLSPSGTSIYRNRLNPQESFERHGHVALGDLVLPDCSGALLTTFVADDTQLQWLSDCLGGIDTVIVVRGECPTCLPRTIGDAELLPMELPNNSKKWFWMTVKPHTGLMHAKCMLFCNTDGLRLVICGSNLYKDQWEIDRDALWVQDFPHISDFEKADDKSVFSKDLRGFLDLLTKCRETQDQALVQGLLRQLFSGIDFSSTTSNVRLVFSFPRPKSAPKQTALKSGWKQLADSVRTLLDTIRNKHPDIEDGDRRNMDDSLMYAMAGSFGSVKPEFLLQMYKAMLGIEISRGEREWDEVEGLIRCLWPSRQTALSMNLLSFMAGGTAVRMDHWKEIPERAKRTVFLDTLPNPEQLGLPHMGCHPFSHAKVMIQTGGKVGVIYVGSHNFSVSAWGFRGTQPKNIELGVVVASTSKTVQQEWRERLPCFLPDKSAKAASNYIPASAYLDIRTEFAAGNVDKAIQMFTELLNSKEISDMSS